MGIKQKINHSIILDHQYKFNRNKDITNFKNVHAIMAECKLDPDAKETMTALQNQITNITNIGISSNFQSPAPYFVTYTPKGSAFSWNNRTSERLLLIQEVPSDPIEPPKHKRLKVPRCLS